MLLGQHHALLQIVNVHKTAGVKQSHNTKCYNSVPKADNVLAGEKPKVIETFRCAAGSA